MNEWDIRSSILNECRNVAFDWLRSLNLKPVYIVLSGSHLYGFPSADSDIDIRCCHIMDTKSMFHLSKGSDILQKKHFILDDGREIPIEFESQEIEHTIKLAMGNNSNILEHIFTSNMLNPETTEMMRLRQLAKESVSKIVYRPYHGMGEFNYKKFIESMNPTYRDKLVKKYLYVMRSYIVGAHALRTGEIDPNIRHHLKREWEYDSKEDRITIYDLIDKKKKAEYQVSAIDHKRCREAIARLKANLELALIESPLADKPSNKESWDDFLYNIRLRNI
jgi:predicted nucleotidyltransferase